MINFLSNLCLNKYNNLVKIWSGGCQTVIIGKPFVPINFAKAY